MGQVINLNIGLVMENTIQNDILERVEKTIALLTPEIQSWVKKRLITPLRIELVNNLESKNKSIYWLVTDHIGEEGDGSYRVVYDEDDGEFGLECSLEDGTLWFMGNYGTFAEAIKNM